MGLCRWLLRLVAGHGGNRIGRQLCQSVWRAADVGHRRERGLPGDLAACRSTFSTTGARASQRADRCRHKDWTWLEHADWGAFRASLRLESVVSGHGHGRPDLAAALALAGAEESGLPRNAESQRSNDAGDSASRRGVGHLALHVCARLRLVFPAHLAAVLSGEATRLLNGA